MEIFCLTAQMPNGVSPAVAAVALSALGDAASRMLSERGVPDEGTEYEIRGTAVDADGRIVVVSATLYRSL